MSTLFGPRLAAILGIGFAVFLFLGVAALETPSVATDAEVTAWWSDDGNQDAAMASLAFVALSAFTLALFAGSIRDRLNAGGGTAGNAMYGVALTSSAMLLGTAAARGAAANALIDGEPLPGVDTLRFAADLARMVMEVAVLSCGVSATLAGWATLATRAFPAWAGWASLVLGGMTIVGVAAIGALVIPILLLWAIAMSVATWRAGSAAEASALRTASAHA